MVKGISYKAPRYVVFSSLPPLLSAYVQIRFSNILKLCSSLSVRDQVSHPYKKNSYNKGVSILHDPR